MNDSKRVVIVCRVSTVGQEDNYSLGVQEDQCRKASAERGYQVVAVYRDVISASIRERPGLSAAIDLIESNQADILMTSVLDRLTRDQTHAVLLMDEVERAGGAVEFALEELDDSPMGMMIMAIKAGVAALERERLVTRISASLEAKKAAKEPLGPMPFGFTKAEGSKVEVVVDEAQAELVHHIFTSYANGMSLLSLANQLESEGYKTPSGNTRWGTSTLARFFENPRYMGRWPSNVWVKQHKKGQKSRDVKRPESEWSWSDGPSIVSPELWYKVNQRRVTGRESSPKSSKDPTAFLLRGGYAICGICSGKMHGITRHKSSRAPEYQCGRNRARTVPCKGTLIPSATLDEAVWDVVKQVLSDPSVLQEWLDHLVSPESRPDATSVRDSVDRLEAELDKVATRYAGAPTAILPHLEKQIASLTERLETAQTRLQDMEALQNDFDREVTARQRLKEVANHSADELERLDYTAKRGLIDSLGIRATVWPKTSEVRYSISINTEVALSGPVALQPSYFNLCNGRGTFAESRVHSPSEL